jgi:hypothetical protein
MLPACSDRNLIMTTLEVILDKMNLYGSKIKNPLLENHYIARTEEWIHKDLAVNELLKRNFFKRFSFNDLSKFISKMKVKQYRESKSLIYTEDKACIILSGSVMICSHAKSLGREPEIIAKLTSGDVLGLAEIDNGISTSLDNWNVSISSIEVIWMNKSDLRDIWPL